MQVPVTAWLEAFAAHPRIGDFNSLKKKYQDSAFQDLSRSEQGSALDASQEVLQVSLVFMTLACGSCMLPSACELLKCCK